jgi:hypothetical protein
MTRKGGTMDRTKLLKNLGLTLGVFYLVLSLIFILIGHLRSEMYFQGVGVGLLIAGVTSVVAGIVKMRSAEA